MRSFRPISDETVTSKYFQYTALRVVFGMTSNVNHFDDSGQCRKILLLLKNEK